MSHVEECSLEVIPCVVGRDIHPYFSHSILHAWFLIKTEFGKVLPAKRTTVGMMFAPPSLFLESNTSSIGEMSNLCNGPTVLICRKLASCPVSLSLSHTHTHLPTSTASNPRFDKERPCSCQRIFYSRNASSSQDEHRDMYAFSYFFPQGV